MKTLSIAFVTVLAAAGIMAAQASAALPAQDQNWLTASISGDRFEIAGGKIALARARTPAVKALARRLVRDHSKSLQDALELAREWGLKGPPSATPSEQWELNRLRYMPRSWFDAQYTALEIKDHNQDLEETGFEARRGQVFDVRHDARMEMPMLNMHLRLSKAAAKAATAANSG
jgi:putative membrane protein